MCLKIRKTMEAGPISMGSLSESRSARVIRLPRSSVPFLLPRSSRTAPDGLTRIRACRRETEEWSMKRTESVARPIRFSPGRERDFAVSPDQPVEGPFDRGRRRRSDRLSGSAERVSEAAHGSDDVRATSAVAQCGSQLADEIGKVRLGHEDSGPQFRVELALADRLGPLPNQNFEHLKSLGPDGKGVSSPQHLVRVRVEDALPETDPHRRNLYPPSTPAP